MHEIEVAEFGLFGRKRIVDVGDPEFGKLIEGECPWSDAHSAAPALKVADGWAWCADGVGFRVPRQQVRR